MTSGEMVQIMYKTGRSGVWGRQGGEQLYKAN
jgi:hypothetical protein